MSQLHFIPGFLLSPHLHGQDARLTGPALRLGTVFCFQGEALAFSEVLAEKWKGCLVSVLRRVSRKIQEAQLI